MSRVEDNRGELARLINEHLEAEGITPVSFARRLPASKKRSFFNWKAGVSTPRGADDRRALEEALGWREGAVDEILDAPITHKFDLGEVRDWGLIEGPPVARASELSTDELLLELTRRVGAMQSELEYLKGHDARPPRKAFGLAANDRNAGRNTEHLEN